MNIEAELLEVDDLSEEARQRVWQRISAEAATPRQRSLVPRVAAGLVAASACGYLVYATLSPTSAYASWTAVPVATSISAADPRVESCQATLPAGPAESVGSARRLLPVVAESRGSFDAVLLAAGDSIAVCIFDDLNRGSGRTVAPPLPAGEHVSLIGNGGSLDPDGARYAYGRVSGGVDAVQVTTADGLQVTASVADGYFLAWWPSPAAPRSVTASGDAGTLLQELRP